MKKSLIAIMIICLFIYSGCSSKFTKYKDDNYSFSYLSTWNKPSYKDTTLSIILPDGKSNISFTSKELTKEYALNDYTENTKKTIANAFKLEENKIEIKDEKYNNISVKTIKYKYLNILAQQTIMMPDSESVIIITYTSGENSFEDEYDNIKKILNTFKYTK